MVGRSDYPVSRGEPMSDRGTFSPVPIDNFLTGDGKSESWRGPACYVPSERRWISLDDYRVLPMKARRDAIYFGSEDAWIKFMRDRDSYKSPSGFKLCGKPVKFTANSIPLPTYLPWRTEAWTRTWDSPGLFFPSGNLWLHEHKDEQCAPREALMFYNEEDWLKFKYMAVNPDLEKKK